MSETLTIHRDWTTDLCETKYFTLEYLLGLMYCMGMNSEDFSEFMTGLNCDTYADQAADVMKWLWTECSEYDEDKLEGCYNRCMEEVEFQTCYTVYRLWNSRLTEEEAIKNWKESCLCTLEGMLEEA